MRSASHITRLHQVTLIGSRWLWNWFWRSCPSRAVPSSCRRTWRQASAKPSQNSYAISVARWPKMAAMGKRRKAAAIGNGWTKRTLPYLLPRKCLIPSWCGCSILVWCPFMPFLSRKAIRCHQFNSCWWIWSVSPICHHGSFKMFQVFLNVPSLHAMTIRTGPPRPGVRLLWHRIIFSGQLTGGGRSGFSVAWHSQRLADKVDKVTSEIAGFGLLSFWLSELCFNAKTCWDTAVRANPLGLARDTMDLGSFGRLNFSLERHDEIFTDCKSWRWRASWWTNKP